MWGLLLLGLLAHANGFRGAFLFDDTVAICENPHIRTLWPLTETCRSPAPRSTVDGRPLLSVSLALNYAVSGLDPWSYHAFNLMVHLGAGLLLYGLVRRTLTPRPEAGWLAFAIAGFWILHPIQTQAVTYIVQRAESLAAGFYLLTLYAACRDRCWLAVLACAAGMATKEVMVTAPLAVVLYDRAYRYGSLKGAWKARAPFYLALASTWVILGMCIVGGNKTDGAGFGYDRITPLSYALTQCGVVLRYLRLSLWPHPLVFDYGWPAPTMWTQWLPQMMALVCILGPVLWALGRNHPLGFPAFGVFLVLAPTSSVMPVKELIFEYRMYLPLAGVAAVLIPAAWHLAVARGARPALLGLLLGVVLAGLGTATHFRNRVYLSGLTLWDDTLRKRPGNARASCNLGIQLYHRGHPELAEGYLRRSFAQERKGVSIFFLGMIWADRGDLASAERAFDIARHLDPGKMLPQQYYALIKLKREQARRASPGAPADAVPAPPRPRASESTPPFVPEPMPPSP